MSALKRWSGEVEKMFHIPCELRIKEPVLIHDATMSTHLYRIAQEAVNNAVKHGKAQNIAITLLTGNDYGTLKIENDGAGLPQSAAAKY